eukprot:TRINITY_DN7455_c0_g1_i1.p3 TRINITY_DN7455_c0_g1~~TRINITY_DN7455_c0_g1_i1.p3  ORF type:complete len:109 (-),score=19.44 TRINITY_DN7455_c0_g1_i1:162-488(-)
MLEKVYLLKGKSQAIYYGQSLGTNFAKKFEFNQKEGYGYFYFINNSNNIFTTNITFNKMDGLIFLRNNQTIQKDKQLKINVQPRGQKIIVVKIDLEGFKLAYTETVFE